MKSVSYFNFVLSSQTQNKYQDRNKPEIVSTSVLNQARLTTLLD